MYKVVRDLLTFPTIHVIIQNGKVVLRNNTAVETVKCLSTAMSVIFERSFSL